MFHTRVLFYKVNQCQYKLNTTTRLIFIITVKKLRYLFTAENDGTGITCNKKSIDLYHFRKAKIIIVNGMYTGFVMKLQAVSEFEVILYQFRSKMFCKGKQ